MNLQLVADGISWYCRRPAYSTWPSQKITDKSRKLKHQVQKLGEHCRRKRVVLNSGVVFYPVIVTLRSAIITLGSRPSLGIFQNIDTTNRCSTRTQACRSFLWGGAGVPSYDHEGTCCCSCEKGWKTYNLVAHASCVPQSAYQTFGYVGLVLSLAHLIHATYNLKQQVSRAATADTRTAGT